MDTKGVHVYEGPSKLYENATIKTDWIESFCMKLNLSFICFQELYEISCMWCIKCLKRLETSELNGIVYLMKCNPQNPRVGESLVYVYILNISAHSSADGSERTKVCQKTKTLWEMFSPFQGLGTLSIARLFSSLKLSVKSVFI